MLAATVVEAMLWCSTQWSGACVALFVCRQLPMHLCAGAWRGHARQPVCVIHPNPPERWGQLPQRDVRLLICIRQSRVLRAPGRSDRPPHCTSPAQMLILERSHPAPPQVLSGVLMDRRDSESPNTRPIDLQLLASVIAAQILLTAQRSKQSPPAVFPPHTKAAGLVGLVVLSSPH
jgi:hypothetical protein